MKDMNRVFLMGRLGTRPTLSTSKNGKPYARLRLATHRRRLDERGEEAENASDWHTVWVWGPQAEACAETMRVGEAVFVEGYLTYWQEADGKVSKSAIHASSVHFVGARSSENLDKNEASGHPNAVAHPA